MRQWGSTKVVNVAHAFKIACSSAKTIDGLDFRRGKGNIATRVLQLLFDKRESDAGISVT